MDDAAIKAMSVEERLELIDQLWDSLEPQDISLTQAQQAELDRRLETLEEDMKTAKSWEEVKKDLERLRS